MTGFRFNTVISALTEFTNAIGATDSASASAFDEARDTRLLLAPIAPFMADEMMTLPVGASEATVKDAALKLPNVQKHLGGKTPTQVLYVAGKTVSIVVK